MSHIYAIINDIACTGRPVALFSSLENAIEWFNKCQMDEGYYYIEKWPIDPEGEEFDIRDLPEVVWEEDSGLFGKRTK